MATVAPDTRVARQNSRNSLGLASSITDLYYSGKGGEDCLLSRSNSRTLLGTQLSRGGSASLLARAQNAAASQVMNRSDSPANRIRHDIAHRTPRRGDVSLEESLSNLSVTQFLDDEQAEPVDGTKLTLDDILGWGTDEPRKDEPSATMSDLGSSEGSLALQGISERKLASSLGSLGGLGGSMDLILAGCSNSRDSLEGLGSSRGSLLAAAAGFAAHAERRLSSSHDLLQLPHQLHGAQKKLPTSEAHKPAIIRGAHRRSRSAELIPATIEEQPGEWDTLGFSQAHLNPPPSQDTSKPQSLYSLSLSRHASNQSVGRPPIPLSRNPSNISIGSVLDDPNFNIGSMDSMRAAALPPCLRPSLPQQCSTISPTMPPSSAPTVVLFPLPQVASPQDTTPPAVQQVSSQNMLSSARSMPLSSAPFINTQHPSSTYVTAVAPQEAAGTQRATGPRTVVAHPVPAQQYRTVKCQPIPMGVDLESAHTIVLTRTSGPRMRSGSTTMRCLPQKRPVEARTGSTPTPTLQSPEGCKRPKVQDEADPFEGKYVIMASGKYKGRRALVKERANKKYRCNVEGVEGQLEFFAKSFQLIDSTTQSTAPAPQVEFHSGWRVR